MKLEELKKEAEEKLFRNLLPRDRMRVTRQRKADAEAQRLKSVATTSGIQLTTIINPLILLTIMMLY